MGHAEVFRSLAGSLAVAAGLLLTGCAVVSEAETTHDEPVTVEAIEGSDVSRLTITEKAAERLDITTTEVTEQKVSRGNASPSDHKIVPYSAILYDPTGATSVYTSPESLVFVREAITIDFIDGDTAALTKGPAVGTTVVTVGVAELYGAEFGVDK